MPHGEATTPFYSAPNSHVREVRYNLPRLLRELELERSASVFAREILDQMEISQIFTTRRRKHERARKQ